MNLVFVVLVALCCTLLGLRVKGLSPIIKDQLSEPATAEFVFKPGFAQNEWTAQQLAMKVSDGDLIRGFFISADKEKMMKKRNIAIEFKNTIEFRGPDVDESEFSKNFEEESTSKDFLETVNNFGTQIAVDGNVNYLFVSAKAGYLNTNNNTHSKEKTKTASTKYFSSIHGFNIPIKAIDLEDKDMILNDKVVNELKRIASDLKESGNNADKDKNKMSFLPLFEKYGSHFLIGTMDLGGTLIVQGTTYSTSSDLTETTKETVSKATSVYLGISAKFEEFGGGVKATTSANDIKSHLSSNVSTETLMSISLTLEKKGGPPGVDNITEWKKGLVEQIDTWRIIDKSTNLIPMWELIRLHHHDQFQNVNVTEFANQMKEAWKYIVEEDHIQKMEKMAEEFENLGISSEFADKRRQLISDMISQGKLGAQYESRYAHLHTIPSGQVVMSALQKEPLDKDTTILQFDSVMFMLKNPHKVYLKLKHNKTHIGHIIMTLDGYMHYPKLVRQMLELSTGMNTLGGTYRGCRFAEVIDFEPGDAIACFGYIDDNGHLQYSALFPVEHETDTADIPVKAGQLLTIDSQSSGFMIRIKEYPGEFRSDLLIGNVTYGFDILQQVTYAGSDFLTDVTFSDSGIVVIDAIAKDF